MIVMLYLASASSILQRHQVMETNKLVLFIFNITDVTDSEHNFFLNVTF